MTGGREMIHQEKGTIFNELIETISKKGLEGLVETDFMCFLYEAR